LGRLKGLVGGLLFMVWVSGAAAQDMAAVRSALSGVFTLDHASCLDSLAAREADFAAISQRVSARYQTLNHAYEGHRLACEAARIMGEVSRLGGEGDRLGAEVARLDQLWAEAVAANPSIEDYPGRNRSQLAMQATMTDIAAEIAQLTAVATNLREAAEGMLALSLRDLDDLTDNQRRTLFLALDVQSQNDILCRMLGCPPATAA
jgi:hypothetical protein